jgi:hypothetical protein
MARSLRRRMKMGFKATGTRIRIYKMRTCEESRTAKPCGANVERFRSLLRRYLLGYWKAPCGVIYCR